MDLISPTAIGLRGTTAFLAGWEFVYDRHRCCPSRDRHHHRGGGPPTNSWDTSTREWGRRLNKLPTPKSSDRGTSGAGDGEQLRGPAAVHLHRSSILASLEYIPTEILGVYVILTAILSGVVHITDLAILLISLILVPVALVLAVAYSARATGIRALGRLRRVRGLLVKQALIAMIAFVPWALIIHPDALAGVLPVSPLVVSTVSLIGIVLLPVILAARIGQGST